MILLFPAAPDDKIFFFAFTSNWCVWLKSNMMKWKALHTLLLFRRRKKKNSSHLWDYGTFAVLVSATSVLNVDFKTMLFMIIICTFPSSAPHEKIFSQSVGENVQICFSRSFFPSFSHTSTFAVAAAPRCVISPCCIKAVSSHGLGPWCSSDVAPRFSEAFSLPH